MQCFMAATDMKSRPNSGVTPLLVVNLVRCNLFIGFVQYRPLCSASLIDH